MNDFHPDAELAAKFKFLAVAPINSIEAFAIR